MNLQMNLAKVSASATDGVYRWTGTCSDDRVDQKNTRVARSCFRSFIQGIEIHGPPLLNVAHYADGVIGVHESLWVDGHFLKNKGRFDDGEPLAEAAKEGLLEDAARPNHLVQQSVGFYPESVSYEDDVLVYQSGWLEHTALTTIPVNPRTDARIIMQSRLLTQYDDAAYIVGPDMAAKLEEMACKRKRRPEMMEGKSMWIPDLPLGSKLDSIIDLICQSISSTIPIVVFSDDIVETPHPLAPVPIFIDGEFRQWLEKTKGKISSGDQHLITLARHLIQRQLSVDMSLSDNDVVELMSNRPSYEYLSRLVNVLKAAVDGETWNNAHRIARGYAGGKRYPVKPTSVMVDDYQAKPTSRIKEVTSSTQVPRKVRAFVSILEAIDKSASDDKEKINLLLGAIDDLHSELVSQGQTIETRSDLDGIDLDARFMGLDKKRQIVYGIVLEPGITDEGYILTIEETEKGMHSLAKSHRQIWLSHGQRLEGCDIVEIYCAPCDMIWDDPELGKSVVKRGTGIIAVHVQNPEIFSKIEQGELTGFSARFLFELEEVA